MASSSTFSSEERRLVLVGRVGVGKSATGNTILGKKVFKESFSGVAVTKQSEFVKDTVFSRELLVVDTPGLFDIQTDNEETLQEIVKCLIYSSPGPHVVAFVMRVDRVTAEIEDSFKIIMDKFGENVHRNMMIIFTGKDDLDHEETSIEDYIKESPSYLSEVLSKCNDRYVAINNRAKGEDKIAQQREIMNKVDEVIEENRGQYYSSDVYEVLSEELHKKWKEMKPGEQGELVALGDAAGQVGFLDLIRQKVAENQEEILDFVIQVAKKFVLPLIVAHMAKKK